MTERNEAQNAGNTQPPLRAPIAPVGGALPPAWTEQPTQPATVPPVVPPQPEGPPPWPEPNPQPIQPPSPQREPRRVERIIRDNRLLAGCLTLAAIALLCGGGSVWADRTFFGGGGGPSYPYPTPNTGLGQTPPAGEATPTPSQAAGSCPDPTEYALKPDIQGYSPGFGVNTAAQGGAVVALYYPAGTGEPPLGNTIYGTQLLTTEIPSGTNEQFPRAAGRAWIYSASCTSDQIGQRENSYDQTYQVPHVDLTTLQQEGLAVDPSQMSATQRPEKSVLAQVRAKDPFRVQQQTLPAWRRVVFRPM